MPILIKEMLNVITSELEWLRGYYENSSG
jgi:hypothetical protein